MEVQPLVVHPPDGRWALKDMLDFGPPLALRTMLAGGNGIDPDFALSQMIETTRSGKRQVITGAGEEAAENGAMRRAIARCDRIGTLKAAGFTATIGVTRT